MKKNLVKLLVGSVVMVGLGLGAYFLLKEEKESDVPDLDEEDDDLYDEDIASDFEKEESNPVEFEKDVTKVFDSKENTTTVEDCDETIIVGEPSDYENDSFMEACDISREEAIKVILEKMPQYKEEDLVKMIGSELAYIYSMTEDIDTEVE